MKQRFLVPVDGSGYSLRALDVAAQLAKTMNAELVLCNVVDSGRAARLSLGDPGLVEGCYDALRADGAYYLDQALQRATLAKVDATTVLAYGDPSEEIEKLAAERGASMIVMGTHGRTGLLHLVMGSVAEGVMRHAGVPVVVVPPERASANAAQSA